MKPFLSPSLDLRRRLTSLDLRSALPLRHIKGRRWDWGASGCGARAACGGRGPAGRRRGDTPVGYQRRQRLSACFFSRWFIANSLLLIEEEKHIWWMMSIMLLQTSKDSYNNSGACIVLSPPDFATVISIVFKM
ncbi:uncharacterized protein LOC125541341 isoform X2 [Triticum urartu]|uniref:uncharacterized protein LOC125541341 isoform X2 n=1 Tax=Triticum urartu TaxID=4572 RepID=UPI0020439AE3|nr:uncharacterized protein LOC125541341 isoform X2 [Triticum urartu]